MRGFHERIRRGRPVSGRRHRQSFSFRARPARGKPALSGWNTTVCRVWTAKPDAGDSIRFADFFHEGMNGPGFAGIGKTDAATAFFQQGMNRAIFLDLLHVVRKQAGGKIEDFTGALRFDRWVGDRVANVDVGYSFADQDQVPAPYLSTHGRWFPCRFPTLSG